MSEALYAEIWAMSHEGTTPNKRLQAVAERALACGDLACVRFVEALASGEPVGFVIDEFARLTPENYRVALAVLKKGGAA